MNLRAHVQRMGLKLRLPWLVGVAVALTWAGIAWGVIYIAEGKSRLEYRAHTQQTLVEIRDHLHRELQGVLGVPETVSAFIAVQGEIDSMLFSAVVSRLVDSNKHIRNIGLAPGNVISSVYPLKGNEKAIGLRYMDTPSQREAVVRAIETRRTVVAGPFNLVQGGMGLASRTPVFRTGVPGDAYWGIVSLVVNVDSLFTAAGLRGRNDQFEVSVRGVDAQGAHGMAFVGKDDVFAGSPVTLDYPLPGGGSWQLGATPIGGWSTVGRVPAVVSLFAYLLAAVVGVLSFWIVVSRQHIIDLAAHDRLTGLLNRRLFDDRLSQAMIAARRHGRTGALLLIDLDGFKEVNDRFGHRAGDLVLMRVGQRLGGLVRGSDSAARIGGDEFALVLPEIETSAQAEAIGQRAIELLSEPMDLGLGDVPMLGASVGIAVFGAAEEIPGALFERADRALYRSKREGKGRVSADSAPDPAVEPSTA